MFSRILNALFGCMHSHISFPITIKKGPRSGAAFFTGTYVVCLDCGKELPYSLEQMSRAGDEGSVVKNCSYLSPSPKARPEFVFMFLNSSHGPDTWHSL